MRQNSLRVSTLQYTRIYLFILWFSRKRRKLLQQNRTEPQHTLVIMLNIENHTVRSKKKIIQYLAILKFPKWQTIFSSLYQEPKHGACQIFTTATHFFSRRLFTKYRKYKRYTNFKIKIGIWLKTPAPKFINPYMSKEPIFRLFKPPLECQRPICRLLRKTSFIDDVRIYTTSQVQW